jgi:DNA-binding XRE family transcriptional regulator
MTTPRSKTAIPAPLPSNDWLHFRVEQKTARGGGESDFLGLSPEEEAYIELRLNLADGLKARRSHKKLTQVELAKSLGSSQSRVAKMEAGDPTVSVDLLVRSLIALGADSRDIAKIIAAR